MKNPPHLLVAACVISCCAVLWSTASAQSTIDSTRRYAYSANGGWIDFRGDAGNGVKVTDTYLTGYAYAANFGWINIGGSNSSGPANGHTYANISPGDFGVNVALDGKLTGYAYCGNIGWIAFNQSYGSPALDVVTGKFTGFAWSGNIGWISLAGTNIDLATARIDRPDTDGDGIADPWERFWWNNLTTANATSDFDHDGVSDIDEYRQGTDPTDRNSWFHIIAFNYDRNSIRSELYFASTNYRTYNIEYAGSPAGPWTPWPFGPFRGDYGNTTGKSSYLPITDRGFFRVSVVQPLR